MMSFYKVNSACDLTSQIKKQTFSGPQKSLPLVFLHVSNFPASG